MKKIMNDLIKELGDILKKKHLTLVTAESCTGGGIAYHLSIHPASSPILERGFIVYSSISKEDLLQVKSETLQIHGAVSKETAQEMAEGALDKSTAQIALATTGIAGPDVESSDKNQGIIYIACASIHKKTLVSLEKLSGEREDFIEKGIIAALEKLITYTR